MEKCQSFVASSQEDHKTLCLGVAFGNANIHKHFFYFCNSDMANIGLYYA